MLAYKNKDVTPVNHFMGAVVLLQEKTSLSNIDSRVVIDGQQRLSTIQLLFAAIKVRCKEQSFKEIQYECEKYIFNTGISVKSNKDKFKLIHLNDDSTDFFTALESETYENLKEISKLFLEDDKRQRNRFVEAVVCFYDRIVQHANDFFKDNEKDFLASMVELLRDRFYLVSLNLNESEDPQVIFETLNARGTPLSPSDLIKNFLFHSVQTNKKNPNDKKNMLELVYKKYWEPQFIVNDIFWKSSVQMGRYCLPASDAFYQYFLVLKSGKEVTTSVLYPSFQRYVRYNRPNGEAGNNNSEDLFCEIGEYAESFRRLSVTYSDEKLANKKILNFLNVIKVIETTTLHPMLLELFHVSKKQSFDKEGEGIVSVLESYLVRRLVCGLTTKNYNRLFLELLNVVNKNGWYEEVVRDFFLEKETDSVRWPDDKEFELAWLKNPLYTKLSRKRLKMILMILNRELSTKFSESSTIEDKDLTIEHLIPQTWQTHWPLPGIRETDTEELEREEVIHTIGNLTVLNGKLNPKLSNGTWKKKRKEILKHSILHLNKYFQDCDEWSEESIIKRGRELFKIAQKKWNHPSDNKLKANTKSILREFSKDEEDYEVTKEEKKEIKRVMNEVAEVLELKFESLLDSFITKRVTKFKIYQENEGLYTSAYTSWKEGKTQLTLYFALKKISENEKALYVGFAMEQRCEEISSRIQKAAFDCNFEEYHYEDDEKSENITNYSKKIDFASNLNRDDLLEIYIAEMDFLQPFMDAVLNG